MARFFYVVRTKAGQRQTGFEEGVSADEVIGRLQAKDLMVVDVSPEYKGSDTSGGGATEKIRLKTKHFRITSDDLVLFCRQLATLLGAGVTILNSLNIIAKQVASKKLFNVTKEMQKNMEAGLSFHEALARHPEVFSDLWVNQVESGEASGNLATVLNRLAGYLERNAAFKSKVISALIYPAVLLFASVGALLFLTIKIIPTFANLFEGFDIKMPLLTMWLIAISTFIRAAFIFILIGLVVGFFLLRKYVTTKQGRKKYEQFLLKAPLFGEFFRILAAERFASEMSTLLESGVPILYALEIAEHSVANLTLGEVIHRVKDDVREGRPLSKPLDESGFFEPMAVQMVAIGEEIGELPNMFKKLDEFYYVYIETFLQRLTSLFEPIMLIFMGGVIGIMVIGMFLPIFQITQIR